MNEQGMLLIESDGQVYRGPMANFPKEIWNAKTLKFEAYTGVVPKPIGWGNVISQREFLNTITAKTRRTAQVKRAAPIQQASFDFAPRAQNPSAANSVRPVRRPMAASLLYGFRYTHQQQQI